MTATVTEIEILEALDFDHDTPCDGCDSAAEWKITTCCCGRVVLGCTPCLNGDKEFWEQNFINTCHWCLHVHKMGGEYPHRVEPL